MESLMRQEQDVALSVLKTVVRRHWIDGSSRSGTALAQ